MKMWMFISLLLAGFWGAGCDSDPASSRPAGNYYPLTIGNYWEFKNPHPTALIHREQIWRSDEKNGKTYFAYGSDPEHVNWVRQDAMGRVWKFSNNREIIWFDFTLAPGCYYKYNDQPVLVVQHETMRINDVTYHDCLEFRFDHPQWADDEVNYVFAKDVGPIKIYGAWVYYELVSYKLL